MQLKLYVQLLMVLVISLFHHEIMGQNIRVNVPYSVDHNYNYVFFDGGRYVMGTSGGLPTNNPRRIIWNARTGRFLHGFERTNINNYKVIYSPDRNWTLYSNGEKVFIVNTLKDFISDSLPVETMILDRNIRFSPDSRYLMFQDKSKSRTIVIYTLASKKSLLVTGQADIDNSEFSPDGSEVYLVTYSGQISGHRTSDGRRFFSADVPIGVNMSNVKLQVDFAPADSTIQILENKTLWLLNMNTSECRTISNITMASKLTRGYLYYISDSLGEKSLFRYEASTKQITFLKKIYDNRPEIICAYDFCCVIDYDSDFRAVVTLIKNSNGIKYTVAGKYNNEVLRGALLSPMANYLALITTGNVYLLDIYSQKQLNSFSYSNLPIGAKPAFLSPDGLKLGIKGSSQVDIYPVGGFPGFDVTLQTGGDGSRFEMAGFADESRGLNIFSYNLGTLTWSFDSALLRLTRPYQSDMYSSDSSHFVRTTNVVEFTLHNGRTGKRIADLTSSMSDQFRFFPSLHALGMYDQMTTRFALWDWDTGKQIWGHEIRGYQNIIFDNKDKIFITGDNQAFSVYKLSTGKLIGSIPKKNLLNEPIIDDLSHNIYAVDSSGKVWRWRVEPFQKLPSTTVMSESIKSKQFTCFLDDGRGVMMGNYEASRFTDTFSEQNTQSRYCVVNS